MAWRAFRRNDAEGTHELPVIDYLKLAGIKFDTVSNLDSPCLGVSAREQDKQAVVATPC